MLCTLMQQFSFLAIMSLKATFLLIHPISIFMLVGIKLMKIALPNSVNSFTQVYALVVLQQLQNCDYLKKELSNIYM